MDNAGDNTRIPLLRWYGLMYLVAFTTAWALFRFQVKAETFKS